MRLTDTLPLRRILFSGYHPFHQVPKPSKWMKRERLHKFMAVGFSRRHTPPLQWNYGQARDTVKSGYRVLNKTFIYMDMQRKDRPMLEKYVGLGAAPAPLTRP